MRLKLFIALLHLATVLSQDQYSYYVNDTIGTEVFHSTTDYFYIYNTQLDDCRVFRFLDGELSFFGVYDFNLEFPSLNFSCPFLLNNSTAETFRVFVADTNDHTPVFSAREYSKAVDEQVGEQVPEGSVDLPTAADPDLPPNDVQFYFLSGHTEDLKYFYFNSSTPALTPTGTPPIDREERSSFHFNLTAYDGGTPPRISSVISINVLINDLNDHSPLFLSHNSYFRIKENQPSGYILGVFSVEDRDSGSNGDIVYRLSSQKACKDGLELSAEESSIFGINASSGQVGLLGELDYENFDNIKLTVEARDSGQPSLSNSTVIEVVIIDQFDSLPRLIFTNTHPGNVFMVWENSPPSLNFLFIVIKPALSGNATANLTLLTYPGNSTDTQPFSISRVTDDWIFRLSEQLDRERIPQYELTVLLEVNFSLAFLQAYQSSQSSLTRLTVQVMDVNDESPQFLSPPSGCVSIEENYTGPVLTLAVSDSDTDCNAELIFNISSSPPGYGRHFGINNSSGELRVVEALDYEVVRGFDLNVTVSDKGTPPLSNSTAWSVCLTNINDNPIIFNQSNYTLLVPVNSLLHTRLATVHASDRDNLTAPIFYYLSGHSHSFNLSAAGDLTLASCLQQEQVSQLQVSASHCPNESNYSAQCEVSKTSISVRVTEMVSLLQRSNYTVCLPKDNKTYSIRLFSLGSSNLKACHFLSSFGSSFYTENNHLYINYNLSHLQETCSEYLSCNINVSHACDSNHSEHVSLNFLFVDKIDSQIQFSRSSHNISRKEDTYANLTVLDLSRFICSDSNRAISFSLAGDSVPPNIKLTQSGQLVLNGTLDIDFPNAIANYTFTIEAKVVNDSASATVLFQIIATNDNDPEFIAPISHLTLNFSYQPGKSVAKFSAEDKDRGSDTQFSYELSIALDWLVADEFTGSILISENISPDTDFDKGKQFNGTMTVNDGGSPSRNKSHTFSVIIGERFEIIRPPSYWFIPAATVCLLVLILVVLLLAVLLLVSFCRNKFFFTAKLRLDSTKSSRVWEVLENNNVAYVCGSVKHNGEDAIVDSISKSTKSSGLGVSIDSCPSLVVPMTDEEIKRIIDSNRDLVQQLGAAPQLEDYNEDSPAPPTLAGEDSDLHLVFGDEFSQVSISNGDKGSQDESPIDIIFSNPDTRFLCPSHSPQSSASSSYLSSVSHQRPRIAYNVPHPMDAAKKPEVRLAPLPSAFSLQPPTPPSPIKRTLVPSNPTT